MQKVDLSQFLDMLINEEHDTATELLHQFFVEKAKAIHENLMQEEDDVLESDDLTQGIKDDKDSIESEEYYSDSDLHEEGDEDETVDAAATDSVEKEEDNAEQDGTAGLDANEQDPELSSEDPSDSNVSSEEDKTELMHDLQSQLQKLQATFDMLNKVADQADPDVDSSVDMGSDPDASVADSDNGNSDAESDVEESAFGPEDFASLEENFGLKPVKKPEMKNREVGSGAKVSVNDKSPIPQEKTTNRVGGKAVSIKSSDHKGYEREKAPSVKTKALGQNTTTSMKSVKSTGDKSALLNKKDGFGSDSPKSVVGSKDMRGSDFKRK